MYFKGVAQIFTSNDCSFADAVKNSIKTNIKKNHLLNQLNGLNS